MPSGPDANHRCVAQVSARLTKSAAVHLRVQTTDMAQSR